MAFPLVLYFITPLLLSVYHLIVYLCTFPQRALMYMTMAQNKRLLPCHQHISLSWTRAAERVHL